MQHTSFNLSANLCIGIVLSRLKITPEGIKDDLMRMDDKLLSREKVVALLKCVPTPDEVCSLVRCIFVSPNSIQESLVKGYSGDAPLAPVEQFLLQVNIFFVAAKRA